MIKLAGVFILLLEAIVAREEPHKALCALAPKRATSWPTYLIIGVGKCGTSSLYYYLQEHPCVLSARQKQIQWFDHQYMSNRFAISYLRNFPAKQGAGEVTGEASPGYVAYSAVPGRVLRHLPQVRILCIIRDPASRAYSAYHYNYMTVARGKHLPFAVLIQAEIEFLTSTKCGVSLDRLRHEVNNSNHALDLSGECFMHTKAAEQTGKAADIWLRSQFPDSINSLSSMRAAVLPRDNQHLWRQLLSRSLYALYLVHWFKAGFSQDSIHLVCSERLSRPQDAVIELDAIAHFLDLPYFNFTPAVHKGKYNAGSKHRGYQALTPWEEAHELTKARPPIPADAHRLIDDFASPFSAFLFENLAPLSRSHLPRCDLEWGTSYAEPTSAAARTPEKKNINHAAPHHAASSTNGLRRESSAASKHHHNHHANSPHRDLYV